ncbi:uncharacterized protein conserved in bacteria [Microbacterium testaceum StLB037]|uniref:Uncharacterized protein conserved in bacteria n=1 Tax=Microbacterium testaceum (strain StLB037) TaxID=979556 RepID=E8N7E3_MICTS|nr:uncharacterized protein conserved in bacteria [Microbacterium testaceum StLB037]
MEETDTSDTRTTGVEDGAGVRVGSGFEDGVCFGEAFGVGEAGAVVERGGVPDGEGTVGDRLEPSTGWASGAGSANVAVAGGKVRAAAVRPPVARTTTAATEVAATAAAGDENRNQVRDLVARATTPVTRTTRAAAPRRGQSTRRTGKTITPATTQIHTGTRRFRLAVGVSGELRCRPLSPIWSDQAVPFHQRQRRPSVGSGYHPGCGALIVSPPTDPRALARAVRAQ